MASKYPFYLDRIDPDIEFSDAEIVESHPPHPDDAPDNEPNHEPDAYLDGPDCWTDVPF